MKKQQTTKTKALHKNIIWLKKRKDILSIFKIEKDLDMSEGTLKKFVEGTRGLADQWHKPVIDWVKEFKK